MAKQQDDKTPRDEVLRRYHAAARGEYGLFFSPLWTIPLLVIVLQGVVRAVAALDGQTEAAVDAAGEVAQTTGPDTPWWWYAILVAFCLLFPLWAKVKTVLSSRYTVSRDAVMSEEGFISRRSSEIRIRDIRNFTVQQNIVERVLNIGHVAFSSSAGDRDEVIFRNVSRPQDVKRVVRDIQHKVADGVLDSDERADLGLSAASSETAPAPTPPGAKPSSPKPASPAAPTTTAGGAPDDDSRDELYRLLAEQESSATVEKS